MPFDAEDHLVVHPSGHWVIKRLLSREEEEGEKEGRGEEEDEETEREGEEREEEEEKMEEEEEEKTVEDGGETLADRIS